MEDIRLDRLIELGAGKRLLQYFGEKLPKGGMLGRARRAMLVVGQSKIDRVARHIQNVCAGEFDETGTQKHVVMNVIEPHRQMRESDFGGVRLKLHPGRMDKRQNGSGF